MSDQTPVIPDTDTFLMSLPEVAELAQVRRPVVTNWRRRHPDFPKPVVVRQGRPMFDGQSICAWLVETGRARRDDIYADLRLYTLSATADEGDPKALFGVLTSLICLQHCDGEPLTDATATELAQRADQVDPGDEMVRSELAEHPELLPRLAGFADELIEAAWGAKGALDRVVRLYERRGGVIELRDRAVHPQLASLMAELSGAARHAERLGTVRIADAAAGTGDLLLAAAGSIGEAFAPVFTAAEPDPFLGRLLMRRFLVQGVPREDVTVAHTLAAAETPDVIVTALPVQPGESRSTLDVLHALDDLAVRLRPGCTAVVLGPAEALASALRSYSPEERLRAKLLATGMVEAVIRLPGGMVPARPGYESALWVLTATKDERSRGWLLLGDIADRELTPEVVDACVTDVVTWRRDGYRPIAHTRTYCVQAQVSELVERPRALTPRMLPTVREYNSVIPGTVARINELEVILAEFADSADRPTEVTSGIGVSDAGAGARDTIAGLVKRGWLRVIKGSRIADGDATSQGHHRVLGRANVCGDGFFGERRIDRAVLASYPRTRLTEPGDVLVTLVPRPAVYLDERGFSVAEFPVRILRVTDDGDEYFTPRVLTALLQSTARARSPGAVRPPRKLTEWELPILEPQTVWRLDRLLDSLDQRQKRAEAELDAITELRRLASAGVANATLTFPH
ncbi:hypothetical protein SAMN05216266_101779 [Amycolatopsis marina]|uniref:N-6 DNA Methylase n=1 Tax=Amycolatopsis marina TaxID=490629 RepID=A0A1I0W620_9PSEU|nr:hypothetical protein [Amycolatopsis marina]SFA84185.1 hypothetical protein SAMN05216266_101779 [Amycolatopsis marina]